MTLIIQRFKKFMKKRNKILRKNYLWRENLARRRTKNNPFAINIRNQGILRQNAISLRNPLRNSRRKQ